MSLVLSLLLILTPLIAALGALAVGSNRWRPVLLPVIGTFHLALTLVTLGLPAEAPPYGWLVLDPLGKLILLAISVLFFFCAFYATGYLRYRNERSNRVFTACLLGFLGLVSLVVQAHHLGLMWVAIEGTTLVTAPLIYFNRTKLSIEATWKFLMVGSVGIALALLGTFFLAYATLEGGLPPSLSFDELVANGSALSKPWVRAGFVLLLVGYGTKMGLAPLHSWKPDTYGECPGVVGALFAGGVASAAFLALTRVYQVCQAAGETEFASRLLLLLGLLSLVVAGVFLIGQKDIKRMLAYSSVEHMGILALGLGIGKVAFYGTVLHVVNNALTKGVLFLSAGNLQRAYGSKSTDQVRGALKRLPVTGALFFASFLAITGSPPFAPFVSEFAILKGAWSHSPLLAGTFLLLLLVIFLGMAVTVLKVVQGRGPAGGENSYRDSLWSVAPPLALMAMVLLLGITIPYPLARLVDDAVAYLEARP